MSTDLTPNTDTDDVLQEETVPVAMTAIPVVIEGPVRTVELPSAGNLIMGQRDVDNTTAERLFGRDPRRKKLTLFTSGGALRIATSQNECRAGSGAIIPTGMPGITITASSEVWVMASSGSATTVSFVSESWAD
jgi:hypothetical protein